MAAFKSGGSGPISAVGSKVVFGATEDHVRKPSSVADIPHSNFRLVPHERTFT